MRRFHRERAFMQVEIFTDGSARGNPGPGGYGAVMRFVDSSGKVHEKELSQGFEHTTNNRMELMAVVAGLEVLKRCAPSRCTPTRSTW